MRRCPDPLAQLKQGRDTEDRCAQLQQVRTGVRTHLLVALWVMLSDGPGSGLDHPPPDPRPVLVRDAAPQQTFELWRRTEVVVRPACQVLRPAVQQGALTTLLQDKPNVSFTSLTRDGEVT